MMTKLQPVLSVMFECGMDGKTNGWTDERTDGRSDRRTDEWANGLTDESDGRSDGRTEGRMDLADFYTSRQLSKSRFHFEFTFIAVVSFVFDCLRNS